MSFQYLNFWFPIVLLIIILISFLWYLGLALAGRRKQYKRVEQDGGTVILGKFLMEVSHFMMTPVGNLFSVLKFTPNMITSLSVCVAAGAGFVIAHGLLGLGGGLAAIASIFDLVDGMVARKKNLLTKFGKLYDSFCDRLSEFFILAGILFLFRENTFLLICSIALIAGSFLGSYLSALVREQGVHAGRGFMRRPERVAYLVFSLLVTQYFPHFELWGLSVQTEGSVLSVTIILLAVAVNLSVLMRVRKIYLVLSS